MDKTPKLNEAKLTSEQRDKLEQYQQTETQIQTLEDIAKMTQEVINILDNNNKDTDIKGLGSLLMDIRESLTALNDKEMEVPDHSTPVVAAVSKLEKSFNASIKTLDMKPQIHVDTPKVNVTASPIDLKGIEKLLNNIPKAFGEAINKIPEVDIPEYPDRWDEVLKWLEDIDTGTRMKPQPGSIKVSNLTDIDFQTDALTDSELRANPLEVTNSDGTIIGDKTLLNNSSTAYEASRVIKASAGKLFAVTGYNSKSSAQFIQLHDSATLPSDTAVPVLSVVAAPSSNFSIDFGKYGRSFVNGIVICNSSTGPTKTIGSNDIWADCQYV